jgi:hypothetical protein
MKDDTLRWLTVPDYPEYEVSDYDDFVRRVSNNLAALNPQGGTK